MKNKLSSYVPLILITLSGFILRFYGISKNLSFWNDEINSALMGRGILWYGKPITPFGSGWGIYQIALNYITALSFKLFGISEWAGRLPSVLAGTALIVAGFFVVKKMLGVKQATLVALLVAFSQIQLAWSTELRPYIWLELLTLLIIFYLSKYFKTTKVLFDSNLIVAGILSGVAILFHGTGLISLMIVSLALLYKTIKLKQYIYLLALPIFGIIGVIVLFNSFTGGWSLVISSLTKYYFSPLHYRIFLTHNYLWLLLGATLGFVALVRWNMDLALLLGISIIFIFFVAIFKINPNYVRYSLPAFPLMYVLFAEGVVSLVDYISQKEYLRWLLIVLAASLLSLTGKFVFTPQYYYSINADVRENPIVDYKLAFSKINTLTGGDKNILVIDAWDERLPWFLPNQKFAVFSRYAGDKIDPYYGEPVIRSIEEFNSYKKTNKSGVVVVEDWESMTPPEINDYIRKNLKFEFTIQDLPYNENDHWGISVYSWGL